jgi:hypothetical protein
MWWQNRRSFLRSIGATASALVVPRSLWARFRVRELDPVRLRAVADAVLPSSLGPEGTAATVDGFLSWLAGYRPGTERPHGYGSGSMEIEYLPPDPTPRWEGQLDRLDELARDRFGADFAGTTVEQRRSLLREEVGDDSISSIPEAARASHVAAALMAFWFGSAAATDAAYDASIGAGRCRSLDGVGAKPAALRQGGGA